MTQACANPWGLIRVEGEEAAKFLHSQLTNSMENLGEEELRLAGFCTAKGRLLGTFAIWRRENTFLLLCKQDTIAALVKRLTMFKLRSKCTIEDVSGQYQLEFVECVDQKPMTASGGESGYLLSFRAVSPNSKPFGLKVRLNDSGQTDAAVVGQFDARLQAAGLPWVCQATVEKYVPQEINFDLVGGIHFEKGCYPGQEVVARSHYIGKVKRRALLAQLPSGVSVAPSQDVWMLGKTNEPAGSVITVCDDGLNTLMMIETIASEGLEPGNAFSLAEDGSHPFTLSAPPYNIMAKGDQYA